MKKTRLIAALVAIIVIILLALMLLPKNERKQEEEAVAKKTIVVAAKDIPAYAVITEEMVALTEYPEALVLPSNYESIEDVVGSTTLISIAPGEMILKGHVQDPEETSKRLALKVEDGMRAMTVSVDDISGISNLLKVGDYVDIVLSSSNVKYYLLEEGVMPEMLQDVVNEAGPDGELEEQANENDETTSVTPLTEGPMTTVVMQDVEIIALNRAMVGAPVNENGVPSYSTVTFSITPEDEVRLAWAFQNGSLFLALRSEGDHEIVEIKPFGVWNVYGPEEVEEGVEE